VLDDLPVLVETEDVDACPILVLVSWPFLMAVQDDVDRLSAKARLK